MDLIRSNLSFDRRAIMSLAHLEYGAAAGRKSWSDCLTYAWSQAKREREEMARGAVNERLRAMRAHHVASLRARVGRGSLQTRAQ